MTLHPSFQKSLLDKSTKFQGRPNRNCATAAGSDLKSLLSEDWMEQVSLGDSNRASLAKVTRPRAKSLVSVARSKSLRTKEVPAENVRTTFDISSEFRSGLFRTELL